MFGVDNIMNNMKFSENTESIQQAMNSYNSTKVPNNKIPESSNYGILTERERKNEFMISRYPDGIIDLNGVIGTPFMKKVTNINLNSQINKNTNNITQNPVIKVNFPTTNYTIETFDNYNKKNTNLLFYFIILSIIIIICLLLKKILT